MLAAEIRAASREAAVGLRCRADCGIAHQTEIAITGTNLVPGQGGLLQSYSGSTAHAEVHAGQCRRVDLHRRLHLITGGPLCAGTGQDDGMIAGKSDIAGDGVGGRCGVGALAERDIVEPDAVAIVRTPRRICLDCEHGDFQPGTCAEAGNGEIRGGGAVADLRAHGQRRAQGDDRDQHGHAHHDHVYAAATARI